MFASQQHPDGPVGPGWPRRPGVLVFDVNETLSDMAPIGDRFEDVGAPAHVAGSWFAGLLRDGFALTVVGENPGFAALGADGLHRALGGLSLNRPVDEAVDHIMAGFAELQVHPDVVEGVRALSGLGIRLVTLSNGSASIAERLLTQAGLADAFESFLSVEQAGIWKPAPRAYGYAMQACGVGPAEAMLVAVHPWDTDGASRAGLGAAWINRVGGRYPGYFRQPDLQAASLPDLAEQLR